MNSNLIITFSIFFSQLIHAQLTISSDTLKTAPGNEKIHLIQYQFSQAGSFSNPAPTTSIIYKFRVGEGKTHGAGYFGGGLRKYIASNPEAVAELDEFKSKRIKSMVGYAGGFALGGIGVAIGLNKDTDEKVYDSREGKYVTKKEGNMPGLVFVGMAVVSFLIGGEFYLKSGQHLVNAVQIYNDGQEVKNSELHYDLAPEIDHDSVRMRFCLRW